MIARSLFVSRGCEGTFLPGLSRTVKGCQGLSRAVKGCQGLSRAVKGCQGLSRAVKGCQGLSRAVRSSHEAATNQTAALWITLHRPSALGCCRTSTSFPSGGPVTNAGTPMSPPICSSASWALASGSAGWAPPWAPGTPLAGAEASTASKRARTATTGPGVALLHRPKGALNANHSKPQPHEPPPPLPQTHT